MRRLILLIFFLLAPVVHAQEATVAVAANMKEAFGEILAAYKASGGPPVRVVYGSSGNFSTQIMNGAPFNLFIAADEQFPLQLYKQGKTTDAGAVYAIGKLVLIANTNGNNGVSISSEKPELIKALAQSNKIAIAKPELAPYGKAAVEYLKGQGLWDVAKNKLVYADNVGSATGYVVSGAANVGFTALSLAKSPEVAKQTRFILIDDAFYQPIKQRMVLIKGAPLEAVGVYRFMQSSQAKSILQKYGYVAP